MCSSPPVAIKGCGSCRPRPHPRLFLPGLLQPDHGEQGREVVDPKEIVGQNNMGSTYLSLSIKRSHCGQYIVNQMLMVSIVQNKSSPSPTMIPKFHPT